MVISDEPDQIENAAAQVGLPEKSEEEEEKEIDFLSLVREAESQADLYQAQVNRKAWTQSLRAFHNEHFTGSKYTRNDWRNRSKFFRAKTRSAVRKDMAAVASSLFNNIDAVNCLPGNEADKRQKAAAAVMQELVNFRTDRASGHASIPWFAVAMGARQDSLLTGICLSKQSWLLELRKTGEERVMKPDANGVYGEVIEQKYAAVKDRPDCQLFPPENFVIDPAAEWTDPVQSAAYLILKWPMHPDEVRKKQRSPVNPWNEVPESSLRSASSGNDVAVTAIRRAREQGLDRIDETQTGTTFGMVWVYETFMRVGGEDYCFYSLGAQEYLTDPRPVREVYPEQFGERPLAMGFGSLESHRIFPMSPAESWQMYQLELNDMVNLQLDAIKQNVLPVTKVVRGRQVDLEQVRRRSSGAAIMVNNKDDVTWERPPDIPASIPQMTRELELEFDDLAGQFNGQTAENNNALSHTLGGLRLVSGTANAVQEFDIRVWIETWAQPVLAQIVRLEQYYEHDPIVLGLCGQRAQLFEKYGVNLIDDELLEQEVTIRVSVGLGAGDPQQRLLKFQTAANIAAPLLAQSPDFMSGKVVMDWEAVANEVFGAAGYRDGGARFFKEGEPKQPDQTLDLKKKELEAKIAKDERTGKAALMSGLAALQRVALGNRELEAEQANQLIDQHLRATDLGNQHAHRGHDAHLAATDHGHRHGMEIANLRAQAAQAVQQAPQQNGGAGAPVQEPNGAAAGAPSGPPEPAPPPSNASSPPMTQNNPVPQAPAPAPQPPSAPRQEEPQPVSYRFVNDPKTGHLTMIPIYPDLPPPGPAAGMPVMPPR